MYKRQAQEDAAEPYDLDDVAPVSYTHLDVYKRQGQGAVAEALEDRAGTSNVEPDSRLFLLGGCIHTWREADDVSAADQSGEPAGIDAGGRRLPGCEGRPGGQEPA